jgi:hypothetical protein
MRMREPAAAAQMLKRPLGRIGGGENVVVRAGERDWSLRPVGAAGRYGAFHVLDADHPTEGVGLQADGGSAGHERQVASGADCDPATR